MRTNKKFLVSLAVAAVAVGVGFLIFRPESKALKGPAIMRYAGFSLPEGAEDLQSYEDRGGEFTLVYSFKLARTNFSSFLSKTGFQPVAESDDLAMNEEWRVRWIKKLTKPEIADPKTLGRPILVYRLASVTESVHCAIVTDTNLSVVFVHCSRY
jgi:hypothetical protein